MSWLSVGVVAAQKPAMAQSSRGPLCPRGRLVQCEPEEACGLAHALFVGSAKSPSLRQAGSAPRVATIGTFAMKFTPCKCSSGPCESEWQPQDPPPWL